MGDLHAIYRGGCCSSSGRRSSRRCAGGRFPQDCQVSILDASDVILTRGNHCRLAGHSWHLRRQNAIIHSLKLSGSELPTETSTGSAPLNAGNGNGV